MLKDIKGLQFKNKILGDPQHIQVFINEKIDLPPFYLRNLNDGSLKEIKIECNPANFITLEYTCTGDLSKVSEGNYIFEYEDYCGKSNQIKDIKILDLSTQRLISMSPSFINKDKSSNTLITLSYNNNFDTYSKPKSVGLLDKNTKQIIDNGIFDVKDVVGKKVMFNIPYEFIQSINLGDYNTKLILENDENEILSLDTLIFGERLSLYENKQRLPVSKSNCLNKTGVIFMTGFEEDRILKVTYNNQELSFYKHENFSQILLFVTEGIFTQTGKYTFKIYEKGFENDPLIYVIEIVDAKGNDIIANHFYYKKTKTGKAYITISVSDEAYGVFYKLNDTGNPLPLSQPWSNSFVLETDIDEGYYMIYKNLTGNMEINNNTKIYVIKDMTDFIEDTFDECQINYCNQYDNYSTNCYRDFIVNNLWKYNINSKSDIYYGLYSLKTKSTTKLILNNNRPQINQTLNNGNYYLQVLRDDHIDDEPIVLFQKFITLSNLKIDESSKKYDNNFLSFRLNSLCINKNKINIPNSSYYNSTLPIKDSNSDYYYEIDGSLQYYYNLSYNNYISLGNISTMKDFTYEISVTTSENLKAKFTIKTINPKFPAELITNINIVDNNNSLNNKIIKGDDIRYVGTNYAYVEIPASLISKQIYISSIGLQNGINYQINKKYLYTFDKLKYVNPEYLYSYKNTDIIQIKTNPYYNNIFLTYGDTEYKFSCSNKNCKTNDMEYGKDYYIDYYDNIILHCIKYEFNNKCQSSNDKKNEILFYLHSERTIKNIQSLKIKLIQSTKKTEISNAIAYENVELKNNIYTYIFNINSNKLVKGEYYVQFNGTSFSDYKLIIVEGKNIINIIGTLYSNYDKEQFYIVEFKEILDENDILSLLIYNEEKNVKIKSKCDLMLDNNKALICYFSQKINSEGEYKFGYVDECGKLVLSELTINIVNYSNPLPYRYMKQYDISNSNEKAEIQFNTQISNIQKVTLIRTDALNKEIEVIDWSSNANKISFSIDKNTELGDYFIKFVYNNGKNVIVPMIYLYDGNFGLINYDPLVRVNPYSLNSVSIPFKGKYHHNQIVSVYLMKDNNGNFGRKNQVQFKFDKNLNLLNFTDQTQINELIQYHIEIVGEINHYHYYLYYIKAGTKSSHNLIFNKNNYFLEGPITSSLLCNIINTINSNSNLIFKVHFCTLYQIKLGLDYSVQQPDINSTDVQKSKIILYDSYNNLLYTDDLTIYTQEHILYNIPIINNSIYKTYTLYEYGTHNYKTVLELNDNYKEIINLYNLGVMSTRFPYPFDSSYSSDKNNNLFLYNYRTTKNNNDHTFLIRHPLDPYIYINSLFKFFTCPQNGTYFSIKNNDIACESCAENYPNTPNKDLLYNKCISSCQTGYLYSDNHQCYQDCEDLILLPLFYENKKCVYECSKGYARDNENSKNCHSCKSIVNGICVACSGYSCFYDDINEQDCSTYHCLNEGTCYMKNREPVCLCVGDYSGAHCETNYKEATKKAQEIHKNWSKAIETTNNSPGDIVHKDKNGNAYINAHSENAISQVKDLKETMKNEKAVRSMGQKVVKETFHLIGNSIMQMLDGQVDLTANIIHLFDCAVTICQTNLKVKKSLRMRRLQDFNYDDDDDFIEEEEQDIEINEEEELNKLYDLLNKARIMYKQLTIQDIKDGKYDLNDADFEYSKERSIYYQRYSNKKSSYSKLSNDIGYNDELMFVDSISCFNENNDIIFISVTLPSSSMSFLSNSSSSSKSFTDIYDFTEGVDNVKYVDITACNNITAYLPIDEKTGANIEKYKTFRKANIDMYRSNDTAFNDACYITHGLGYDLTQKYRRMKIFENKTLVSDDCRYDSIDIERNKVKMYCDYVENFTYSYRIEEEYLKIKNLHQVENLPLKCASYVEKLYENIGFWTYFIFNIIIIIGLINCFLHFYNIYIKKISSPNLTTTNQIICVRKNSIKVYNNNPNEKVNYSQDDDKSSKESDNVIIIQKGNVVNNVIEPVNEDNNINGSKEESKEISKEESKEEEESELSEEPEVEGNNKSNDHPFDNVFVEDEQNVKEMPKEEEVYESYEGIILELPNKEPFKNILIHNFKKLYPFMNLFRNTLRYPLFINISFFVFNLVVIFGSNALFYSENIIEKRIMNSKRNTFIYALNKEPIKIILSLLLSMICMLIVRAIIIIPRIQNKKLYEYIKSHEINEGIQEEKTQLKNFFFRRIIISIFMNVFSIFLFYYVIVFCSLYRNTQLNWFISGIWCLLIEWVILSPLYILIISIIEKKGRSQKISSYYMKKLFMF